MAETFEPTDVPALRRDLMEWLRDGRGLEFHSRQSTDAGTRLGHPEFNGHPRVMRAYAEMLCAHERRALADAELYFVTAEMTAIVQAAAASMPAFAPTAEDFPHPAGLIVFEAPLISVRRPEAAAALIVDNRLAVDKRDQPYEDIPIIACTWGPYDRAGSWKNGGVLVSFYRDRRDMLAPMLDDTVREFIRPTLARLVPDNEWAIAYADRGELEQQLREHDTPAYTSHWAKYLLTTLMLMQQPLIYQRTEPVRRGLRRQLERAGYPTGGIRILDARPRRYTTVPGAGHGQDVEPVDGEAGSGRTLSVRVPVTGHWRNHWYPKRRVHRPLWIEDHWRGPEDAPIVHPERVRVLRHHERQPS
ncbi:hypothetical protein [Nonomuraea aridisoli]|uniref:Uncharacterized protein n=1 Tax=Nonomuraea aridisoli TaxID=2070368 RepID=A0A2W2E8L7_9ACTN|nr:hypothetical protein [Nonomuraea aridisoli]PZG20626.1 hypothetical protein C1J01_08985 [Nonomuraea aridisoli]